jgi:hypothetical protein
MEQTTILNILIMAIIIILIRMHQVYTVMELRDLIINFLIGIKVIVLNIIPAEQVVV